MSLELIYSTTIGLGPFLPAIRYGDRLYVDNRDEYKTENSALKVANSAVKLMQDHIDNILSANGFVERKEP